MLFSHTILHKIVLLAHVILKFPWNSGTRQKKILICEIWIFRMAVQFSLSASCCLFHISFQCIYCHIYWDLNVLCTLQSQFLVCSGRNTTFIGPFCVTKSKLLKKKHMVSEAQHLSWIKGYLVWISIRIPAILTCVFHGFPKSLQANARIVPKRRPWLLPSKSIPTHHHS
jgi:hypothetical protein